MFFLSDKQFRELRDKVADLERDFKRLSDEWDDMAALLRRRAGNAARQLARLDEKEAAAAETQEETFSGRGLDPISSRILQRRSRIANRVRTDGEAQT